MSPVSYFLLADSAGLLLCDDTFNLLVEDSLLLHLQTEKCLEEDKETDLVTDVKQEHHVSCSGRLSESVCDVTEGVATVWSSHTQDHRA